MSTRVLTSLLAMSTFATIAAAQTPTPTPSSQAPKPTSITVEGCLQRDTSNSATPGTVGTSGAASPAFVLANAMKPAAAAGAAARPSADASASSASIASSYRLDAEDSKLGPHVGHKVEITGTVADSSSATPAPSATSAASGASMPKLKVDSVKMVAASCTP